MVSGYLNIILQLNNKEYIAIYHKPEKNHAAVWSSRTRTLSLVFSFCSLLHDSIIVFCCNTMRVR